MFVFLNNAPTHMYIVMADVVVADTVMTCILIARLAIVFGADLYSYGPSSYRF